MDEPFKLSDQRLPSLGCCLISTAALGLIGYFIWGSIRSSYRAEHESKAKYVLKLLTTVEAEYRAKDLDGNGVIDFWTGDVAGL